jgi:hypothetical protein
MDSWWEGAAKLLSAGPLGLGAVIVLVTGTILVTGKSVEQGRLKLALCMLLAGCVLVLAGFGVLILQTNAANAEAHAKQAQIDAEARAKLAQIEAATQHQLYFRIEPLASSATLPAPDIIINNEKLDKPSYKVQSDITVIIDVTKALTEVDAKAHSNSPSDKSAPGKKIRAQLSSDIDTSIAQIQRMVQLMSQSCPGGAHGENPFHFNDLVNLTNSVADSLQKTKSVVLTADF